MVNRGKHNFVLSVVQQQSGRVFAAFHNIGETPRHIGDQAEVGTVEFSERISSEESQQSNGEFFVMQAV